MVDRESASIRYNNPGAMWGGNAISRKWGETSHVTLNDGLGQGNQIALFPNKVHGAAAQFDLWRTQRYNGKPLAVALKTWSGGNSWQQYTNFLTSRVPGLTPDTLITDDFLRGPMGILMMKAQAWHEAGKPYPMSDTEWHQAQDACFRSNVVKKPKLLSTRTGQLGTATTILTGAGVAAQTVNTLNTTTTAIQTASDTISTVSGSVGAVKSATDQVIVVYQVAKPFLGLTPQTWGALAIGFGIAAIFGLIGVLWYRHVKLRDTGA